MNRTCPQCGAVIKYTSQDVGNTVNCWDCGARLLLLSEGVNLIGPPQAKPASHNPGPSPGAANSPAASSAWTDVSTWLFGLGALLVIVCLLLPAVLQTGLSRLDAQVLDGDIVQDKARREVEIKFEDERAVLTFREQRLKDREEVLKYRDRAVDAQRNSNPSSEDLKWISLEEKKIIEDRDNIRKDRSEFEKERTKKEVTLREEELSEQRKLEADQREWVRKRAALQQEERRRWQASLLRWETVTQWGLFAGFLFLALGSVGYLSPRQTLLRRIVGAVVLVTLLLLLINRAVGGQGILGPLLSGPSGGGGSGRLSAYNFSTPKNAMVSYLKMEANADVLAAIELEAVTRGHLVREKLKTLAVHREADWMGKTIFFVTFTKDGRLTHDLQSFEHDRRSGLWRQTFVEPFDVERSNPVLAREMREWRDRSGRKKDDDFRKEKS